MASKVDGYRSTRAPPGVSLPTPAPSGTPPHSSNMRTSAPSNSPALQEALATPPSSPDLLSPEHIRLNNVQQFTEMVEDTVARKIAFTIENLEQHIKCIEAKLPDSAEISKDPKSMEPGDVQLGDMTVEVSSPEFKTVDEVWDEKARKYVIVEPLKVVGQLTGLNRYIFVVRRHVDRKTKEMTCYVDIESKFLQDILRDILKDIKGISLNESKLSVDQNLLYSTLPELESCQRWNEIAPLNEPGTEYLGLLVDYIKSAYVDTNQSLLSLLSTGHITYDLLWALFKSNVLVYTTCSGTHKPRCVKHNFGEEKTTNTGTKYWSIDCRYLDFDGEDLGSATIELKISKFRGAKRINTLEAFPLQYHTDATGVQAELLRCGREFMRLRGPHHRQCNGKAFYKRDGELVEVHIDGRIMVDAAFFRKTNPNYFRSIALDFGDITDLFKYALPLYDISVDDASESSFGEASNVTSFELVGEASLNQEQTEIADENLIICCPTVPGFSFKDKLWVEFAVADIEEIEWSLMPFNGLTLPEEQRETIMALTDTELDSEFDDMVEGKGRGVIILLHGNPGVGKTLTAEAVAEHRRNPMYSISVGELSTDAGKLEGQLSKIFQVAKHWNAILLLDEADVYLERRAPQDLTRNGLVSVFLRTMEYCQGVMFLTTNRASLFDPAALSRIHLKLKYNDLNLHARREIWENFLDRAKTSYGFADICDKELERLIKTQLNGREIKNVVSIARKLAIRQKSAVHFLHLKQAIAASKEFMDEFNGTEHVHSLFF